MILDEKQVRKTLAILKPNKQLFEIRIKQEKTIYSGYFTDVDTFLMEVGKLPNLNANCYISLNSINDACYSRSQRDKFLRNPVTTGDKDIDGYEWLLVDLDPVRPSDTSATDTELTMAKALGQKVYLFLQQVGFEKPIMALSGNGFHLLYKVSLKNNADNKELIKKCLTVLDVLFSNDAIKIDTSVFNPARISKLYGTCSQKGSSTPDRPYRMSYIFGNPVDVKTTPKAYLEKLTEFYPKQQEQAQRYNNYSPNTFDLEEWLNRYSIHYQKSSYGDGTKYILDNCPFDESHKGKDACLFVTGSKAIGFKCLHDSCQDKHWKDFRLLYEPNAYDKKDSYRPNYVPNAKKERTFEPIVEKENEPVWFSPSEISSRKEKETEYIPTGITDVDKSMRGLAKGDITVISGFSGGGKSSIVSQIALNAINKGFRVGIYSGELSAKKFLRWLHLQCAGKNHVVETNYENFFTVPIETQRIIDKWLDGNLYLYNNFYGHDYSAFREKLIEGLQTLKFDLIVLDNLMRFDIQSLSPRELEAQTMFMKDIKDMAEKHNVHIMFIAHPRKQGQFLRVDDISGSGNIRNLVDNAFLLHRVNEDFKRTSRDMFGWKESNPIYSCDNCIEIAKDRDGGNIDTFVRLYFEKTTKRLKNEISENVIYGWEGDSLNQLISEKINFEITSEEDVIPFD